MNLVTPAGRPVWSLGAAFVGMVCFSLAGFGQDPPVHQPIDLARALQQTLANNPALSAYPYEQRQLDAFRLQADVRPIPKIGVEVENVLGTGNFENIDLSEFTLVLSQVFEMGGKRDRRLGVADADIERLRSEYDLSRLDVLAETSRRYYQLLRIQGLQELILARIREEQQALQIIESRATAGAVGQADVSRMALRLGRSRALQQQLDDAWALASLRLASMWNDMPDFSEAVGDMELLPEPPDRQFVLTSLDQSPALMNQLALQRLADARVELEVANGKSDPQFGLGLRHLNVTDDQALVFTFSMPLAFRNPNVGRIEAARASMDWSRENTTLVRRKLEMALLEIQQIMVSYRNQAGRLEQTLLPQAESLLSDTQTGYESGRYSVLEWVDAQTELYDLEVELIEARNQVLLQLLELERITGQAMTQSRPGEML